VSDHTLTAACDPSRWVAWSRAELLEAAGLIPDDLKRAVKRNRKLLDAKKVKHFASEGRVVSQRTYEDHEAQLRAVELIYDLAGVKAPRAQATPQSVGVAVEIDPSTGVVRVVAGAQVRDMSGKSA
jgi:hypothetical protein